MSDKGIGAATGIGANEGIGAATGIGSNEGIGAATVFVDPMEGELYYVPMNIRDVTILNNPAPFLDPIEFSITFECFSPIGNDLYWTVTYVGNPELEVDDELLASITFERPIPPGTYQFVIETSAPSDDTNDRNLRGPSVIWLRCSSLKQVFYHRGYFLNNEYEDEKLIQDPPEPVNVDLLQRNILTDHAVIMTIPIVEIAESLRRWGAR